MAADGWSRGAASIVLSNLLLCAGILYEETAHLLEQRTGQRPLPNKLPATYRRAALQLLPLCGRQPTGQQAGRPNVHAAYC